ncbi:MAG: hypothetical protein HUU55_22665 [Myxococcales bacterium]|nr:hypothetical protein [Myxococcales bacterium]
MRTTILFFALALSLSFVLASHPTVGQAACPDVPGDLDGSQSVTVADIQCAVLISLWALADMPDPAPECLAVPLAEVDINCSQTSDIADVLLMIQTVLGAKITPKLDKDNNGCIDVCQKGDGKCALFECVDYPTDCCKPGVVCTSSPCALGPACDFTVACAGQKCPAEQGLCDDGDLCTIGGLCTNGTCSSGVPKVCNDSDNCTADACDPVVGCVHTPLPGCDCAPPPSPVNPPPPGDLFCSISGDKGQEVICPLQVAAGDPSDPFTTAFQFSLIYDPVVVRFVDFLDVLCFGPNKTPPCVPVAVAGPGSFALSTGHWVILSPGSPAEWSGYGGALFLNLVDQYAHLTDAWSDGCASVQGNPHVVDVVFELLQGVPTSQKTTVWVDTSLATNFADGKSTPLDVVFWPEENTFVTWP